MHLHFKALFESERSRMRAGGFTMQQGLTSEAATIVKQAVNLARRRGHAQVTPLHVAHTMLSNPTGLLRTACLQSHSHPLQCRALELCFNVALNRLPASTSSPMLGPQHSQLPSISNALVAAFKRAQAHQRRGSIENQQQPLLAVKIELEQLIISILDDPSVSRVMREASFSSTQVKSNVEQIVSLEICAQNPNSATSKSKESNIPSKVGNNPIRASDDRATDEGAASVIDNLMNKNRRNTVIVGECLATIEGVVRGVMEKFDKGDVPEDLRHVKFIRLPLSSFAHFSREETEHKLVEIRSHVRGYAERGVVLFLGDLLKWTSEYRASSGHHDGQQHGRNNHYCAVEHMIMELGKLVCGNGENGRFWLMGIATFQTYMRCKTGNPSLETVWDLHPLTIPADSLSLSLNSDSSQSQFKGKKAGNGPSWLLQLEGEEEMARKLTCCTDCSANFEMEARSLRSRNACNSDSITTSSLPTWLQQYKDENKRVSSNDQDCIQVRELCKKWNSICTSAHKQQQPHSSSEKTLTFSSVSPSSSTYSGFSYDQHNPNKHKSIHQGGWPVMEHKQPWNDHHFWVSEAVNKTIEPSLRLYIPEHTDRIHPFSSNPNSTPNSASSSDVMEMDQYFPRFKELNPQNLQTLCSALEKKVPWQKKIIPEIATTILQCRSGMVKRKRTTWPKTNEAKKEETWLFFQGVDAEGKEKIARELARLVFGSQSNCVSIALSSFSSTRADSTDDLLNSTKRSRDEQSCSYIERFAEAVTRNPHRVFLVEDIEQADYYSQIGIKRSIERGRVTNSDGEEVSVGDAIVILSCESFSSRSRACSPPIKQKSDEADQEGKLGPGGVDQETSPCVSLDLNMSIDDDCVDDTSIDDIGLLEAVDRRVVFKIIEL